MFGIGCLPFNLPFGAFLRVYHSLHLHGGVLAHFFRDVAVHVERKGHRRVSQRFRYRLGIDARP